MLRAAALARHKPPSAQNDNFLSLIGAQENRVSGPREGACGLPPALAAWQRFRTSLNRNNKRSNTMQITCPRGCHKKENWTYSLVLNGYEGGEFCDTCGSEIYIVDPEAERDHRRYVLKYYLKCALVGAALGTLVALLAQ
jgi:hypothetical protein